MAAFARLLLATSGRAMLDRALTTALGLARSPTGLLSQAVTNHGDRGWVGWIVPDLHRASWLIAWIIDLPKEAHRGRFELRAIAGSNLKTET